VLCSVRRRERLSCAVLRLCAKRSLVAKTGSGQTSGTFRRLKETRRFRRWLLEPGAADGRILGQPRARRDGSRGSEGRGERFKRSARSIVLAGCKGPVCRHVRHTARGAENAFFLAFFIMRRIISPRQARDKRRESTQKEMCVFRRSTLRKLRTWRLCVSVTAQRQSVMTAPHPQVRRRRKQRHASFWCMFVPSLS
jgi:hypothetical protein